MHPIRDFTGQLVYIQYIGLAQLAVTKCPSLICSPPSKLSIDHSAREDMIDDGDT